MCKPKLPGAKHTLEDEGIRDEASCTSYPATDPPKKRACRSRLCLTVSTENSLEQGPKCLVPEAQLLSAAGDIYDDCIQHWRNLEAKLQPCSPRIWQAQAEVNPLMRQILVEWMFELCCDEFKMSSETFLVSINYLDRYLSQRSVLRSELQLVGAACLWLAAKYEEVNPPSARQLVGMTADTYGVNDLISMESKVLSALGFDMGPPTPLKFLHYYAEKANIKSASVGLLAKHLIALATLTTSTKTTTTPPAPVLVDNLLEVSSPVGMAGPGGCFPCSEGLPERCCTPDMATLKGSTMQGCHAHAAWSMGSASPAPATSSSSCGSPATVVLGPCTPEPASPSTFQAAAQQVPDCLQQQGPAALCCLGAALPSHLGAAALVVALALHQQPILPLLPGVAQLAQCEPGYLMQLCQALSQLQALLSSSLLCAMSRHYHDQRQQLEAAAASAAAAASYVTVPLAVAPFVVPAQNVPAVQIFMVAPATAWCALVQA